MLDHLATYALAYILLFAFAVTGLCIWSDAKRGYISNPFKK